MKQIFVENIKDTPFVLPYDQKKSFYYVKDNDKLFVYCGRYMPSKFEVKSPLLNPYKVQNKENQDEISQVITSFKKDLWEDIKKFDSNNNILSDRLEFIFNLSNEKRDIHLFCWCSPNPCHCDVIKNLILALRDEEKILNILPITEEVPFLENPIPPFTPSNNSKKIIDEKIIDEKIIDEKIIDEELDLVFI